MLSVDSSKCSLEAIDKMLLYHWKCCFFIAGMNDDVLVELCVRESRRDRDDDGTTTIQSVLDPDLNFTKGGCTLYSSRSIA